MGPAQENGVCWGIGEEEGESNEAAGEFGQESGEGGHRSMLCNSIAIYFTSTANPKAVLTLSPGSVLSSCEARDLPLTESKSEPETDLEGAKRGLEGELRRWPPILVWRHGGTFSTNHSSSCYNGPLSHTSAPEGGKPL